MGSFSNYLEDKLGGHVRTNPAAHGSSEIAVETEDLIAVRVAVVLEPPKELRPTSGLLPVFATPSVDVVDRQERQDRLTATSADPTSVGVQHAQSNDDLASGLTSNHFLAIGVVVRVAFGSVVLRIARVLGLHVRQDPPTISRVPRAANAFFRLVGDETWLAPDLEPVGPFGVTPKLRRLLSLPAFGTSLHERSLPKNG